MKNPHPVGIEATLRLSAVDTQAKKCITNSGALPFFALYGLPSPITQNNKYHQGRSQ